jgi:site-specific recombinase XerD
LGAARALEHRPARPSCRTAVLRDERCDSRPGVSAAAARAELRRTAATAGVRRRFAPHQLCHAHAVEAHEGVPLIVIQRQLGHSNLGLTSIYLQGIDDAEIIEAVHARRAPVVPVNVSPRL